MSDPNDNQELHDGKWRPACPEPYYLWRRVRCECRRKFRTKERYEAHWRACHLPASPREGKE